MADQGKKIDARLEQRIVDLAKTMPISHVAREARVARTTVYKYIEQHRTIDGPKKT